MSRGRHSAHAEGGERGRVERAQVATGGPSALVQLGKQFARFRSEYRRGAVSREIEGRRASAAFIPSGPMARKIIERLGSRRHWSSHRQGSRSAVSGALRFGVSRIRGEHFGPTLLTAAEECEGMEKAVSGLPRAEAGPDRGSRTFDSS
jgi:hypothetical protein